jgi:hypothetical protein
MTDRLDIPVAFAPLDIAIDRSGTTRLAIATDATRVAGIEAKLERPGVVRDALLALGDVLASDLRRKPGDRADYLKYLVAKNKKVSKALWDAQKEYLALQYGVAAKLDEPLDPVLSIDDTAVRVEVMSRDESTYAQLVLRRPEALTGANATAGTTAVALDLAAFTAIARLRGYRPTTLALVSREGAATTRRVPLRWLRAFGQMQAASLFAKERFELAAVDLYNVLFALRMRKARTAPRGLRYELMPGERPRIVLEPWEQVVHGTGAPYRGARPCVIRTWGRQRLATLARVLPHAKRIEVVLSGQGLPSQYLVDFGDATLALVLSGWTDASWAGVATFDLLAADDDPARVETLVAALAQPATADELATHLGRSRSELRPTLLAALAQLRVGHELATGRFYARPLVATPPPPDALRFSGPREAAAHRIVGDAGAVTIVKSFDQPEGRTIEGQVVDGKAHRTFAPVFTIDRDGRTVNASCTCTAFRRSGMKEGPCEHMIALRLVDAREQARREAERAGPEGRDQITAETRELLRRTARGSESYRISLDGRNLVARFGVAGALRSQHLRFDSIDEAREAYFARLAELQGKGYVDATQG